MSHARHLTARSLPLALAGVILLLGALAATACAAEYGGLGELGILTAGGNGGHLEVNPAGNHAFGVDPADGSSYIADEVEVEGKHYFQIQKLGMNGEYLAETRVELARPASLLEGVAIDSEKQRLYVLVVTERIGEHEEIEAKLEEAEEALEKKKEALTREREKGESTETTEHKIVELEAKIKQLKEESLVFDPEAAVAAKLYAFSTEANNGKLEPAAGTPTEGNQETGLLAGENVLSPSSEEPGVSLLEPHGIAVDPETHDVLILGQQDESDSKEREDLRVAVQRVHTEGAAEGKLGPRYVDEENCLEGHKKIEGEPACAESGAAASSPFVSPGGRVYGERSGELWEIPATEGIVKDVSESFEPGSRPKVYETKPKRLFTVGREQGIEKEEGVVEPVSEEEGEGGALAFVPSGPGEGRIYLDANIKAEEGGGRVSENGGAVVLSYSEHGGTPEAGELGWTAGQNGTGENEKCVVPLGNLQILVGADSSGRLLLFDATKASERGPAGVSVLQFGAGGEECGHARATPPSVSVLGEPVTKMPAGKTASLSLNVFGADALRVEWRFKDDGKEAADEQPVVESYPFPTQIPTLTHEFKYGGDYEIIAIVESDDFGPKIEEDSSVMVEGEEGGAGGVAIGAEFSYTSPATVSQTANFAAKVSDPNNRTSPHAQYKYVWEFGDGAKIEGSGSREFKAEHVYTSEGRYEVKLTVIDEGGRTTEETHVIQVNVPRVPVSTSSLGAGGGGGNSDGGGAGSSSSSGMSGVTNTDVLDATLAGTSLVVSRSGWVRLRMACPAGEASCDGTVTLRTLAAVKVGTHVKKQVLTLAAGSFTIVGGQVKAVTLHLSAKARTLLARSHVLRARATLLAQDPAGATNTTQAIVTLRAAKPLHPHRR